MAMYILFTNCATFETLKCHRTTLCCQNTFFWCQKTPFNYQKSTLCCQVPWTKFQEGFWPLLSSLSTRFSYEKKITRAKTKYLLNGQRRERSCNYLTKSESLIFSVLLKHIDERNTEQKISIIKAIVFCLIMGCLSSSIYKFLALFMFICFIGLANYILACEYNKLVQINMQLCAILLQSEN